MFGRKTTPADKIDTSGARADAALEQIRRAALEMADMPQGLVYQFNRQRNLSALRRRGEIARELEAMRTEVEMLASIGMRTYRRNALSADMRSAMTDKRTKI